MNEHPRLTPTPSKVPVEADPERSGVDPRRSFNVAAKWLNSVLYTADDMRRKAGYIKGEPTQ